MLKTLKHYVHWKIKQSLHLRVTWYLFPLGSHSVTCHLTQVNTPHLKPSQTGQYSIYQPRKDGRLSWAKWLVTCWDGLARKKDVYIWPWLDQRPRCPVVKDHSQRNLRCVPGTSVQRRDHHWHLRDRHSFTYWYVGCTSFKHSLLSVDVDICMYVGMYTVSEKCHHCLYLW